MLLLARIVGVTVATISVSQTSSELQIATAIQTELAVTLRSLSSSPERAALRALYEGEAPALLWIDKNGLPDANAREGLKLLEAAAADGLEPADYGWPRLKDLIATLERSSSPRTADRAQCDITLSTGMLRYLRHLHQGRVDPRAIGFRLDAPTDRHDFAAVLRSALKGHRLTATVEEFTPSLAQYRALRGMLLRYRSLVADTTLEALPAVGRGLRPGDSYSGLSALYRRLITLEDLPAATPAPGAAALYEGALVAGVMHFQSRHGLEPDGVIGKTTQAAFAVPLTWRVRQIELALERLRWLPHPISERLVTLNIPMFRVWAWDSVPTNSAPSLAMDVIVGRALSTQTPVFVEDMREVIFRPYWNVPASILRNEILPILRRDPGYLARQNMEIVLGPGDDAQPVDATAANLALLQQGTLRLRQRPGPDNSLGLVKFVFPNASNIYMHGTPAQALFSRSRRDFSHGCVRVEDPVALAAWTLREQPEWTEERIRAAMTGTAASVHVKLVQPIPVILFYTTAAVLPDDGLLHFAEDIYRHDARLDRALLPRRSAVFRGAP